MFFLKKGQHITSLLHAFYTEQYVHFNNYIQVTTHRIYSFPPMAKKRQIHKRFIEEVLRAQPTGAGPSEEGGQQQESPVTHSSSWAVRMQTRADGPTLPGH